MPSILLSFESSVKTPLQSLGQADIVSLLVNGRDRVTWECDSELSLEEWIEQVFLLSQNGSALRAVP